ncbi:MAG: phosphoethanolamine--lipid A transferase [Gammaproteobacteria bacterium]|nr:phosphoethanolamine--lipid A transferase [Gammaproteobacteria bacterium]
MRLTRPARPETLTFAISIALIALYNAPLWQQMEQITANLGAHRPWVLFEMFLLLLGVFNLLLGLIAWPYIFKPVMSLLFMITALVSYFMSEYGVMIDAQMIQNAAQTDAAETRDLLTVKMGLFALLLGLLPTVWLWKTPILYRTPLRELGIRLAALLATLVLLGGTLYFSYKDLASLFRNNRQLVYLIAPTNYLTAATSYIHHTTKKAPTQLTAIGADARKPGSWAAHSRKTVLVLVVGETARADHFALNGYDRDTNPELGRQSGLINFSKVHSCGTATAVSVPCMFSDLGRRDYSASAADARENLLDVLSHAGFDVLWRDNNVGCKGVCARVGFENLAYEKDPAYCKDGCYDDILLRGLDQKLRDITQDSVIVLHQNGSHGPAYYKRYPKNFERFTPVCRTSELILCKPQELINAFDNTILYTDHVLSGLIDMLRAHDNINTAMIYLSDHGESLGEANAYLHGMPYTFAPEAQKHIPAMMWFSDNYQRELAIDPRCMTDRKDTPWTQDNLFHSVLGALDVQTKARNPALDLFQGCRAEPK